MQIGFVGLGRMGANMVHRLRRDGNHAVVAFDPNPEARASVEAFGATTKGSIDELIAALDKPRGVWIMVPSGKITDDTVAALQSLLEKGDTIIDGGNSNYHELDRAGHHQRRARHQLHRCRNQRRHLGTAGWILPDGRRREGSRRPLAAHLRDPRAA